MKLILTTGKWKKMKLVKKEFTKLVMEITSVLIRSYHCKVAPSSATTLFDSCPVEYFNKKIFINPMTLYWRSKATIV